MVPATPWQTEWSNVVMQTSSLNFYGTKRCNFSFLWKKGQILISFSATLIISLLYNTISLNNIQCMYDCLVFLTVTQCFFYTYMNANAIHSALSSKWLLLTCGMILSLWFNLIFLGGFFQLSELDSDWNFAYRVYAAIILIYIINNTMNGQTPICSNGWN